ncbi:uncharacterized protein L969DRAFT_91886 [Mixia osmundae IAM 14324]|uniref:BTB domain-containing protein n=1 Tax=Mixia osmundae (strain CBS 9802 / IAM 14324 / JCM 22182 / KY 12970) TaxID=764103 RepID=G7E386_MIXOS|nr:uncharacterized protein L969DRAFT_91886 [Mixia osmundae IAM 14324]KEI42444.1 hypothetical protein L969DRAFT_91886 [Mixia osmundae IAM 14324]GAA97267.1 hypothetical protein E5Q_03944 [Mixia osmundae IAM 14324]
MSKPTLHEVYASRDLLKFKSFLSAGRRGPHAGGSSASAASLSRSPRWETGGSQAPSSQVNQRDLMGRTVLHLVVAGPDESWRFDFCEALLVNSNVNVNLQDTESGWTALHRALYHANLNAARALIAHENIDLRLRDNEGLTAFDLYNTTVDGTAPDLSAPDGARTELFTWGDNRNHVLGTPGDNDRVQPERVKIKHSEGRRPTGRAAFDPIGVRQVSMARNHTAIVTDERSSNIRLCGLGGLGRLGRSLNSAQYSLDNLLGIPGTIISVATAQDHTIIITSTGDCWTFGSNRYLQLGYAPDVSSAGTPKASATAEPVQIAPKKVTAVLKKEYVLGAAASRFHSVVFTADSLYTWGTNNGQLGYASNATPTQAVPRKVTTVTLPVLQVAAGDYATVFLLANNEVCVLTRDIYQKLSFPAVNALTAGVYRPPQIAARPAIVRINGSGTSFVAVSSIGDAFWWSHDSPSAGNDREMKHPQRVWDLRTKFSAVIDAAVSGQEVLLCTKAGHVYYRSRRSDPPKGSADPRSLLSSTGNSRKLFKFSRVPFVQRVIKVAANPNGAFAAVRLDAMLPSVELAGRSLAVDLLDLIPHYLGFPSNAGSTVQEMMGNSSGISIDADENESDAVAVDADIFLLNEIMTRLPDPASTAVFDAAAGADLKFIAGPLTFYAHCSVLAARCAMLGDLLLTKSSTIDGFDLSDDPSGFSAISVVGLHPLSLLTVIHYLYTDNVLSLWDTRIFEQVTRKIGQQVLHPDVAIRPVDIKNDVQTLARKLGLSELEACLKPALKPRPQLMLSRDMTRLLEESVWPCDVCLDLEDGSISCHSAILRARSPFFATFFDEADWSARRRIEAQDEPDQQLHIDYTHLRLDTISRVLRFIYTDDESMIFDDLNSSNANDYIGHVMIVMAVANELLLDRLKSACSRVLLHFVHTHNLASILEEADIYDADTLRESCMLYASKNLETLLESRLLDNMSTHVLRGLSKRCSIAQSDRHPMSRTVRQIMIDELVARNAEYLASLDLGRELPSNARRWRRDQRSGISPMPAEMALSPGSSTYDSPAPSPAMRPADRSPAASPAIVPSSGNEDIFEMELEPVPALALSPPEARSFSEEPTSREATPGKPFSWQRQMSSSPAPASLRDIMAGQAQPVQRAATPKQSSQPLAGMSTTPRSSQKGKQRVLPISDFLEPTKATASPAAPAWSTPTKAWATQTVKPTPFDFSIGASLTPVDTPSPRRHSGFAAPVTSPKSGPAAAVTTPRSEAVATNGPLITPMRRPSGQGRAASRSAVQEVPWSYQAPVMSHVGSAGSPSASSFAAITQEQQSHGALLKGLVAPRSLAEIQAEEAVQRKAAEADKQRETEFLAWFEAESQRINGSNPAGAGAGRGRGRKNNRKQSARLS